MHCGRIMLCGISCGYVAMCKQHTICSTLAHLLWMLSCGNVSYCSQCHHQNIPQHLHSESSSQQQQQQEGWQHYGAGCQLRRWGLQKAYLKHCSMQAAV